MKRISGVFAAVVFVLASAFGFAFTEAGAAVITEGAPYNGITSFDMGDQHPCTGQESASVRDAGSKVQAFNGITFFNPSDEKTACVRASLKQGTWPSNAITFFQ